MSTLLVLVGAILLVAGLILIGRGMVSRGQVQYELADQKISFPGVEVLPPNLSRYAGARVRTGEHAKAYADLIGMHVAKATAGRTYAEIADEWMADGRGDQQLTKLRDTAFVGQSLRVSLLSAYQAWQVTILVIGLGSLFTAIGVVFLALAAWR